MSHEDDTSNADASTPEPSRRDADGWPIWDEWDRSARPSTAVIEAVAAAAGREPTALPPLHRVVDADALDALLTGGPSNRRTPSETGANVRVSFAYAGVEVTVSRDGRIEVGSDEAHDREYTGPQTAVELETRLRELLCAARRNGVSVRGGWALRNGPTSPDWDVHVTRVTKPEDEDASDQT